MKRCAIPRRAVREKREGFVRIDIQTLGRIKDNDIRALYAVRYALEQIGTPSMIIATLKFFADRYGFYLIPKG